MHPRVLLGTLLRLFGVWYAALTLGWIANWIAAGSLALDTGALPFYAATLASYGLVVVLCLVVPDRLATWLDRRPAEPASPLPVAPRDLWRFGCQVIGLYALVRAVPLLLVSGILAIWPLDVDPAVSFAIRWGPEAPRLPLFEGCVYAILGTFLLFGPGRLRRLLFMAESSDAPSTSGRPSSASADASDA
jgi:hypothetical protein